VTLSNNYFNECIYAALLVLNECNGITAEGNTFDTALPNTSGNSYLFGQGHAAEWPPDFQVYNVSILNNSFVNNPQWSGVTFHGGSNVIISGNTFVNTGKAFDIGNVPTNIVDKEMLNFVIDHNTISLADDFTTLPAMVITGYAYVNDFFPITHVTISNNNITGGNIGIYMYTAESINIESNNIANSYFAGLMLEQWVNHVDIDSNVIDNIRCLQTGGSYGASFGIYLNDGVYHCNISNNTVGYTESDIHLGTQYGIALGSEIEPRVHVQLTNNKIDALYNEYIYQEYAPVAKDTVPVGVFGQTGDVALDINDNPAYICENPVPDVILADSNISTGILVNGNAGNSFVDIAQGDYWRIPSSCGITIEGAGPGGSSLNTNTVSLTQARIYLTDELSSNILNQPVTYGNAVWERLKQ
jgi:hypothetical protein